MAWEQIITKEQHAGRPRLLRLITSDSFSQRYIKQPCKARKTEHDHVSPGWTVYWCFWLHTDSVYQEA